MSDVTVVGIASKAGSRWTTKRFKRDSSKDKQKEDRRASNSRPGFQCKSINMPSCWAHYSYGQLPGCVKQGDSVCSRSCTGRLQKNDATLASHGASRLDVSSTTPSISNRERRHRWLYWNAWSGAGFLPSSS